MVKCECGAELTKITPRHLKSKGHLSKVSKKSVANDSKSSTSSTISSRRQDSGLESRVITLEKQMNTVLDELVTLQRAIQSLSNTKSTISYNLTTTELINNIGKSGGLKNWITIDSAYNTFKSRNVPFDSFQSKIIELADKNEIELGDGRSNYKIKNRGFEFGLVRIR